MPRQGRKWYPGAQYHIMCRGNRKNIIFRRFDDYNVYLIILGNVKEKYPFKILSYCLMANHIHLQIQTEDVHIGTIMKYLNQRYSTYFNKEYELVGRLFQDRYKSVEILTESATYHVSRYIHLNPVKAEIVHDPVNYEWSSFNGYMKPGINKILDTNLIMSHFETPDNYKNFICAMGRDCPLFTNS